MPNNKQYPQATDDRNNTAVQESSGTDSNKQQESQEQTRRLTPNEAFWKSRREMYAGTCEDENAADECGRS